MEDKEKECYLCGSIKFVKREGKVRDNPNLEIRECACCGLVYLSSFSHITDDFYEESSMHEGEVNIEDWLRETAWDDERRFKYLRRTIENKEVLDFGCGNGGFMLRAKEIVASIEGIEVERRLEGHFQKHDLCVYKNIDEINKKYDIITAFHVIEHLQDPIELLKKLAEKLKNDGTIIIEVPNADDALLTLYKCKAFSEFTYWSCHLYLFNASTLKLLIEKANLKAIYIKQIQRYPLSNHLYWLSCGKPGGHQKWGFLDSYELHAAYEKQLATIGKCDTLLASISE